MEEDQNFLKVKIKFLIIILTLLFTSKSYCEKIVLEKKISHMDAVLWYCEQEGIEPDTINRLISKSLKEKIEANARELNFLPKHAQLPI